MSWEEHPAEGRYALEPTGGLSLGRLLEKRWAAFLLEQVPARLLYHVNAEAVPEGIEFTPDGSQLFVQLTSANHIAVFDVDGFRLNRSPFDIRTGHGPASMALGSWFNKSPTRERKAE